MPAGAPFKLVINEEFDPSRRYFGYVQPFIEHDSPKYLSYVNMDGFIEGGAIGAIQIPDDDALVRSNRVSQGATLLTLPVPDSVGAFGATSTCSSGPAGRTSDPNTCPN